MISYSSWSNTLSGFCVLARKAFGFKHPFKIDKIIESDTPYDTTKSLFKV